MKDIGSFLFINKYLDLIINYSKVEFKLESIKWGECIK